MREGVRNDEAGSGHDGWICKWTGLMDCRTWRPKAEKRN